MQIQKIQFSTPQNLKKLSNNTLSFTHKYFLSDIFIDSSNPTKERNEKINKYVADSKKEFKNLKKTAIAHKKQCLGILKKAQKFGYKGTIDCGDYNITFGEIDFNTQKPSLINIWDEGRMVQQYVINSLEPLNMEVYDCELQTFEEEFYIANGELITYKSHNKEKNKINMVVPTAFGFYKVEGDYDKKTNSIKKTDELQYLSDKKFPSIYSQYSDNGAHHYQLDKKTGNWIRKCLNVSDTLSLDY